jgi:predicted alpha/beta-hydrolase family hydrolase
VPEPSIRAFADNTVEPHVHGYLHVADNPNKNGLILTHGAGSNAAAPLLVVLAETFSSAGWTVLRCDLPYRQARSWGPPGPADVVRDRAGLKNAVACVKKIMGAPLLPGVGRSGDFRPINPNELAEKIFLGGHSYGGRQSSMLCAEEADLAAGLLLLSYPLHPPRKPEQQRTQHLPNLRTPALFVHGTRDPFGSIAEIEQALKMIPAKTKLLPIEGAGHDLGFKGKAKQEELPSLVLSEFTKFLKLSS